MIKFLMFRRKISVAIQATNKRVINRTIKNQAQPWIRVIGKVANQVKRLETIANKVVYLPNNRDINIPGGVQFWESIKENIERKVFAFRSQRSRHWKQSGYDWSGRTAMKNQQIWRWFFVNIFAYCYYLFY